MAKATKRYEDKEILTIEKTLVGVTLELSMEEAEALTKIIGNCLEPSWLSGVYDELWYQGFRGDGFVASTTSRGFFKIEKIKNEAS